ncbi:MAG: hypothetical protein KW788_01045 [Candidatus Doudnabacteria bacterium]|nr:hypothetical protein [Candidatus Doudnabacteria bacterium]
MWDLATLRVMNNSVSESRTWPPNYLSGKKKDLWLLLYNHERSVGLSDKNAQRSANLAVQAYKE